MTLLVAAIAATVAAIAESTITPYLRVGNAQPHLVFVLAVVWTVAVGLDSGLVWAFVGGLALDTLAQRPLGSTAFALLLAVGLTAAESELYATLVRHPGSTSAELAEHCGQPAQQVGRALSRLVSRGPFSCTSTNGELVVLFSVLRPPAALAEPLKFVAPSVPYDVIVAAILGPLAVSIHDRFSHDEERVPR